MVPFFDTVVKGKANIICGLPAAANNIPALADNIYTAGRTIDNDRRYAHLNLSHPHNVAMEANDRVDIHQLMINSLRMRPDRVIIGRCAAKKPLNFFRRRAQGMRVA